MVVRRRTPTAALLLILSIWLLIVGSYNGSFDFSCQAPPPLPELMGVGIAYSVIEASDLSYVIAGERQEPGSNHSDIFLYCHGEKIFGGLGNESAREIVRCHDGGYAVIGYTTSFGVGKADIWLLRTNSNGHQLWNETFGTAENEYGTSLIEFPNGDFAFIGYVNHTIGIDQDVWVLRVDSTGNPLWNRTFGGFRPDAGWSIILNSAGQLIVVGTTESFGAGDEDVWLLCLDAWGTHLWNRTIGGKGDDRGLDITLAHDGGYAIIGSTTSSRGNDTDICLIRTDSSGNQLWNTTYGFTRDDMGLSIITTRQGDFAMTGYADGRETIWFRRTEGYGVFCPAGWLDGQSFGTSIIEPSEGGFIIVGGTNATSAETSGQVYWWLPSHYSPPHIGMDLWFWGFIGLIILLIILAVYSWRTRRAKIHK